MKTNTLTAATLLLLFSCEVTEKQIRIVNPGDDPIAIALEGEDPIIAAPGQVTVATVRFGQRRIRINGGEAFRVYLDPHKEYLVNPLREKYYLQQRRTSRAVSTNPDTRTTVIANFRIEGEYTYLGMDLLLEFSQTAVTPFEGSLHRESDLIDAAETAFVKSLQSISYTPFAE